MSQQRRRGMVENYLVIWVDGNIDMTNEDCQNTLVQLRGVVNQVNLCTTVEQCIQQLNENPDEILFVISSGTLGQHLVPNIHEMQKLKSVYIFCRNKQQHQVWAQNWGKVKGVHTTIKHICEKLTTAIKQYNEDNITVSIVGENEGSSSENLDQLEPTFMYSQIFTEILLEIKHDEQATKDLVTFCQEVYGENDNEMKIIDEFKHSYQASKAIWWYTRQCFTYKMLNGALRTLNGDIMIRIGFFLCDLHRQIEILYKNQVHQYHGNTFTVFRGQGLSTEDFEKLTKNKGGLISFNNFLSTSTTRNVSLNFAKRSLETADMVSILFQITIDSSVSSIPFASIREESYFQNEEEILFSMHTVFRIGDIHKLDNNRPIYQVDLKLTSDDDKQLSQLTDRIRQEVDGSGWYRMGKLLLKIGQFSKAEELYLSLLEQTSDDSDAARIYNMLGDTKAYQGQYSEAISFYKTALKNYCKTLSKDHPTLAEIYNNIGGVHHIMGNYSEALQNFEKALEIRETALPPSHPDLAQTYAWIGATYNTTGYYAKALEFYEKAHQIYGKTLPSNHPDMGASHNSIGGVYNGMGDYAKALEYYEKANQIYEKALPPNHPDLATSYSTIGQMFTNMGGYSKALEFYEKAHKIYEKALSPNHPDLASSYNNIGRVNLSMGDHGKALEFFEKALEINEKALSPNHPSLATSYNNIGLVHNNMGDYSKALEFYEKSHLMYEKAFPPNHPSLAGSHLSFAACYERMGDYTAALKALQSAFKIQQNAFQEGNQAFSSTYSWFGKVYRGMKEYSRALKYFEKCLAIDQKTLLERHPDFGITYSNIGDVHRLLGDYEKALLFHRKALNIQENVQCNPLQRAMTYVSLGETYRQMNNYSTALTYFQKALEIRKKKLPKNHPDLAVIYHNLANIYIILLNNAV